MGASLNSRPDWPFGQIGDVEWREAISACGQPLEASILTDLEWETAKLKGRVVSIVGDETGITYRGVPGLSTERVMCRAVFAIQVPKGITLVNVDVDDINWDFSKATDHAGRASEALLAACASGDLEELRSAIEAGADVNRKDPNRDVYPLQLAVSHGHKACFEALIRANADVSDDNRIGMGSYLWRLALLGGHCDIVQILESNGVQPQVQQSLLQAAREGNITALSALIARGANLNESCSFSRPFPLEGTPLTVAILSARMNVVDSLLSNGAESRTCDSRGVTPWVAAAATGQDALCSRLESLGAEQDLQAALVLACQIGNVTVISQLIARGAAPIATAAMGAERVTPLNAAFESREIGSGDRASGIDDEAAEAIRCEVLDMLLSHGADPNQRTQNARPLLLRAAELGRSAVIAILIRNGADVNISDHDGDTALHCAANRGNADCAKQLLFASADPNAVNKDGKVAMMQLFESCDESKVEIAKWLIAFGADLSITTKSKKTIRSAAKHAIRKAEEYGEDTDSVQMILDLLKDAETGCLDVSDLDFDGLTTLSDAAAARLGSSQGGLFLDDVTRLSETAIESLSKHKGSLSLGGLKTLSEEAVERLAKHNGELILSGVTTLSDISVARLSNREALALGLTNLSDTSALTLSNLEGWVSLDALTTLSDAVAESLSKHKGSLSLGGLKTLSDEAAKSLARHEGDLWLRGLTALSKATAESLSKHKGSLSLDGLRTLSDEAAAILARHEGDLWLRGLTTVSDAAAESLSKCQGRLSLDGLTTLSDAAAESLSRHAGLLCLFGLTTLSHAAAESLTRHPNLIGMRACPQGQGGNE